MLTNEILKCCKELKLGRNIADMSEKINAKTHQEYLLELLKGEIEHRENARKDKFLKNAAFYSLKNFQDFRFDEVTLPGAVTPDYLKNCEFLKTKTNIVMYGNVGTGKTFLSTALGVEACKMGIETRFFRTAALVAKLSEAKKNSNLSKMLQQILKAQLIICDEWGYVPLDRVGSQLLFELISECYEKKNYNY